MNLIWKEVVPAGARRGLINVNRQHRLHLKTDNGAFDCLASINPHSSYGVPKYYVIVNGLEGIPFYNTVGKKYWKASELPKLREQITELVKGHLTQ